MRIAFLTRAVAAADTASRCAAAAPGDHSNAADRHRTLLLGGSSTAGCARCSADGEESWTRRGEEPHLRKPTLSSPSDQPSTFRARLGSEPMSTTPARLGVPVIRTDGTAPLRPRARPWRSCTMPGQARTFVGVLRGLKRRRGSAPCRAPPMVVRQPRRVCSDGLLSNRARRSSSVSSYLATSASAEAVEKWRNGMR